MRATNFTKQEIRCMYRGFKQVSQFLQKKIVRLLFSLWGVRQNIFIIIPLLSLKYKEKCWNTPARKNIDSNIF